MISVLKPIDEFDQLSHLKKNAPKDIYEMAVDQHSNDLCYCDLDEELFALEREKKAILDRLYEEVLPSNVAKQQDHLSNEVYPLATRTKNLVIDYRNENILRKISFFL